MTPANLLPAIQSGQLSLDNIDDKVRRILREIVAFGFLVARNLIPLSPQMIRGVNRRLSMWRGKALFF